ncbi:hypothetical protein LTR85_009994 [Meristemomyces frigidus]|nr:hypothetical protein LTR85_009994 [Meristemomyces frigidus]
MATATAKGASSLAKMAQEKVLAALSSSITTQARSATFACGGSIHIKGEGSNGSDTAHTDAVQVRFGEHDRGVTATFPRNAVDSSAVDSSPLQKLLAACVPASFGRGGDEVMDEDYRKAGKLDPSDFATTFCPYRASIIDVVSQLLLPNVKSEKDQRGVRAELYKLNVYSAPSGRFKPHVDTPRSDAQFGSLVVCLPVAHKGGQLVVRNAGKQLIFDWSKAEDSAFETNDDGSKRLKTDAVSSPAAVKWAAFYSDCEHEVLEVTSGHRVTLTYNLYVTRGNGHLAGQPTVLDPIQLPIYETLKRLIDTPSCFPGGRVLGIWLTHSYAHTNLQCNFLPSSLKGAEMAVYVTVMALGLHCYIKPVIRADHSNCDYDDDDEKEPDYAADTFSQWEQSDYAQVHDMTRRDMMGQWTSKVVVDSKVTWLNEHSSKFAEPAFTYPTYGNDPQANTEYSAAALFIRIPPSHERVTDLKRAPTDMYDGVEAVHEKKDGEEEADEKKDE